MTYNNVIYESPSTPYSMLSIEPTNSPTTDWELMEEFLIYQYKNVYDIVPTYCPDMDLVK
jgi:hypothetical protein